MTAELIRRNGETVWVQGLPLSQRHDTGLVPAKFHPLAACALVIHNSAPSSEVGTLILRRIYGLTPAEIQVVLAIADGDTLKRYAERRGISRHTAVNQLKRVFLKTGIRRQSELVRWLLVNGGACHTTTSGSSTGG